MITINNFNDEVVIDVIGDIMSDDCIELADDFKLTIPSHFRDTLRNNENKTVKVNINSNGGDVFSAFAISNMLKNHKGHTIANIEGLAASSASIIALSCDEVRMPKTAFLMIHKPTTWAIGTADNLREVAGVLDKVQNNILEIYKDKILDGVEPSTVNKMIDDETWLNGEEASKIFNISLNDNKVLNCASNIKHSKQPETKDDELINKINSLKKRELIK